MSSKSSTRLCDAINAVLKTDKHEWQDPNDRKCVRDHHRRLTGYLQTAQRAGVLQTLLVTQILCNTTLVTKDHALPSAQVDLPCVAYIHI